MTASLKHPLNEIFNFLACPTPASWLDMAPHHLETLLIDHANCEMKAASTAMSLIYRHPEKSHLVAKMSPLAREEMLHFEKVIQLMHQRGFTYRALSPSGYASHLLKEASREACQKFIDQLIIGAIIEARSCERFNALLPHLDRELADFYQSLVKSESRHFKEYLTLARRYAKGDIKNRVTELLELEALFLNTPDACYRFHSGLPIV